MTVFDGVFVVYGCGRVVGGKLVGAHVYDGGSAVAGIEGADVVDSAGIAGQIVGDGLGVAAVVVEVGGIGGKQVVVASVDAWRTRLKPKIPVFNIDKNRKGVNVANTGISTQYIGLFHGYS